MVALYGYSIFDIEERMAKGTRNDTGPASNAQILINHNPVVQFGLPVTGLRRAHLNAIGFFTVVADHGKVDTRILPFDNFDPGSARITRPRMVN